MADNRIPVTLLTGFLGSGKTTVLRHLVRRPGLARTLVVINELGEVALDHLLISRVADDTVVALPNGCLCCGVRGDLIRTLKDATWRFARGGERQFDRVVIETTGLADPAPILQTLLTTAALRTRYRLDGVVTTLDLTCAGVTLDGHWEAQKQVAVADCLLLTKADLATASATAALEDRLAALNPLAVRLLVSNGEVDPERLFGLAGGRSVPALPVLEVRFGQPAPSSAPPEPAPSAHDARIHSLCLVIDPPLEEALLADLLDRLGSLAGPDLLRIKGIVAVRGRASPVVIHAVQHLVYPPAELPAWPDADRRSRLVFITRGIAPAAIEAALADLLPRWRGEPAPDR